MAGEAGLLLVPFHNRRFDGDFLTLQQLLRADSVGRPVLLRSRFDRFRPLPKPNTWKEDAGAQNGLLQDLGPHLVDQALVLFGRPQTISASVRTDRETGSIEDAFDIVLGFESAGRELRVELGASMLAAAPEPRFRLSGTRGSFVKYGLDPQEPTVIAGATVPATGSSADWLTEVEAQWGTLSTAPDLSKPGELQHRRIPTRRGDYRMFYEGVAMALRQEAPPPVAARDAVRVARLLEMARESSRAGTTLTIPEKDW